MRFSVAEMLGMMTLITVLFAGLRVVIGDPEAIGGAIILGWTIHLIVCDLIDELSKAGRMRH